MKQILKKFLNILSFALGLFMLINAGLVFYRFSSGQIWELSRFEKVFNSIVTGLVGVLLLIQTFRLIRQKRRVHSEPT